MNATARSLTPSSISCFILKDTSFMNTIVNEVGECCSSSSSPQCGWQSSRKVQVAAAAERTCYHHHVSRCMTHSRCGIDQQLVLLQQQQIFLCILLTIFWSMGFVHGSSSSSTTSTILQDDSSLAAAPGVDITSLDDTIQQVAFAAFAALIRPRTGVIYTATNVPANLSGVLIEVVRLRVGSLRKRGIILGGFTIPSGVKVLNPPYHEVVLVYRDFGNLAVYSSPLPGQQIVSPVLGIKVYSAQTLHPAAPLPPLEVTALMSPITIIIPQNSLLATFPPAFCAEFNDNGTTTVSNVSLTPNICAARSLGDFALLGQVLAPSPSPLLAPPGLAPSSVPAPSPSSGSAAASSSSSSHRHGKSKTWKIVLGTVLGTLGLVAIASLLAFAFVKYRRRRRFARMQHQADTGETLQQEIVGHSRAPAAAGVRTRPTIEREFHIS